PPRAGQQRRRWTKPLDDLVAEIVAHKGRRVTVLATGDPMWFGIGVTLAKHVPAAEMLVIPQAGAFSLAAARLGWPLDAAECVTLHGRPLDLLALYLQPHARLLVLSENGQTPAQVAAYLTKRSFGSAELTVLEHMGGAQERSLSGRA